MRKSALFWGGILILFGTLLLLQNLDILPLNIWKLFWPLLLILLGLWTLWGVFAPRRAPESEQASIPLEGASRARVRVRHGAGRLTINAGAGSGELATGTFGGGLEYRAQRDAQADELNVKMRMPRRDDFFFAPWTWGGGGRGALDWSFSLNRDIPLALELKTGASETQLDLTDLRVADLRLQTGASSTDLTLPAQAGHTQVAIEAGAASITIRVPPGVAARVRATGGAASIDVDQSRFPRAGAVYQSADYDTAPNRVEMDIHVGAGSVDIR